ncbi:hypothetical protein ACWCQ0_26610 [Streptomyces massasporeus]|uniref:Uncharacterized protein n=1 Tax=Streptomyces massasporeus TaxID=67324 RepID=A0ABW6LKJ2_9ACTN
MSGGPPGATVTVVPLQYLQYHLASLPGVFDSGLVRRVGLAGGLLS